MKAPSHSLVWTRPLFLTPICFVDEGHQAHSENCIPEGSSSYTAELSFDPNLSIWGVLSLNLHFSSDPTPLEITKEVPGALFQPPQIAQRNPRAERGVGPEREEHLTTGRSRFHPAASWLDVSPPL